MQELKARYQPLEEAACQPLWDKTYADAGAPPQGKGTAVLRKKSLHILGGAVMRSWGAVQVSMTGRAGAEW